MKYYESPKSFFYIAIKGEKIFIYTTISDEDPTKVFIMKQGADLVEGIKKWYTPITKEEFKNVIEDFKPKDSLSILAWALYSAECLEESLNEILNPAEEKEENAPSSTFITEPLTGTDISLN